MTKYNLTQHFHKTVFDTHAGTFTAVFKADRPCTDDSSFRADVHMHLIIKSALWSAERKFVGYLHKVDMSHDLTLSDFVFPEVIIPMKLSHFVLPEDIQSEIITVFTV